MKENPLYFDSAAAYPVNSKLPDWYRELLPQCNVNPHGGNCYAEKVRRLIISAERRLLSLLKIREGEADVIWTSGVTESLNLAAAGLVLQSPELPVCLDPGAHPALSEPCKARWKNKLICPDYEPAGQIVLDCIKNCGMLACSHVNNETGVFQDLVKLRHSLDASGGHGILFVDGAQSFCKHPIPWNEAGIDVLALSSRKIGGPAAVGALVLRKGRAVLKPVILGGGQQRGLRSGTADAAGIQLFLLAAEDMAAKRENNLSAVRELNSCFWQLMEQMKFPQWVRISPAEASPYVAMLSFPGYQGALISRLMAEHHGIIISSASACTAESTKKSPALSAMGFDDSTALGAVRISFHPGLSTGDVHALATALQRTLEEY